MQCPVCHVDLVMSDKHGIEIDYCPKCRGVWLDRGELDEITRRANQYSAAPAAPQQQERGYRSEERHEERREEHHSDRGYDQKPKKKESFLGDLFDF